MSYADLVLIVFGLMCSLLIGFCAGLLIGSRLMVSSEHQAAQPAALQEELDGWEQWYSIHMRQCALLEQSNRAGLAVLAELESAR